MSHYANRSPFIWIHWSPDHPDQLHIHPSRFIKRCPAGCFAQRTAAPFYGPLRRLIARRHRTAFN